MSKEIVIPNTPEYVVFIIDGKTIYLTGEHVTKMLKDGLKDFIHGPTKEHIFD